MPRPKPFQRDAITMVSDQHRSWHHESALSVHEQVQVGGRVILAQLGLVRDSRSMVDVAGTSQVMLLCGENGWQAYAPASRLLVFA